MVYLEGAVGRLKSGLTLSGITGDEGFWIDVADFSEKTRVTLLDGGCLRYEQDDSSNDNTILIGDLYLIILHVHGIYWVW